MGVPQRVAFVTNAYVLERDGIPYAELSSIRRQLLLPAELLRRQGHAADVISLPLWPHADAMRLLEKADRVVFGKLFPQPGKESEPFANDARAFERVFDALAADKCLVFCFADDHFDVPRFAAFYSKVAPRSRVWIASAETLAERLRGHASCPVQVHPEPLEYGFGAPRVVRRGLGQRLAVKLARRMRIGMNPWRLRLLWFGHRTNVPTLLAELPRLQALATEMPLQLECVTEPGSELDAIATPPASAASAALRLIVTPWSLDYMPAALANCDAVILPQLLHEPRRQAKSNNRMVDALHAGRFVIAHPVPAYAALREYAWIGDSIAEGVRWLVRHPREALRRIVAGQEYVQRHHSEKAVTRFWLEALSLERPISSAGVAASVSTPQALRRTLYRTGEPFFLVYAKDWLQRSAGRRALHLLAHALNKKGCDAYVAMCSVVNPQLFTPLISDERIAALRAAGRPCIAIYPEVIHDDPLQGDVVVRWLLNRPGLFRGDFPGHYGAGDLHFYWTPEYLTLPVEAWPLMLPHVDTSIFHNDNNPHDSQRSGRVVFARKYLDAGYEIEPEMLAGSVDISLRAPEYRSIAPQELASLFRRSRYLVCYEESSITVEAELCGCPVVYRRSAYLREIPAPLGTFGWTTSLADDDIERARAGLPQMHAAYEALFDQAERQVDFLINLCRSKVRR